MSVLIRPISSSMLSSSLKQAVMIDIFFFMVACAPRLLESYDEEPVGYTSPLFHRFNPSTLIMSEPDTTTFSWFNTPKPVKFLVVGAVNTVFGYSCYAGLLFIGLHYSLAALFGTLLGIAFNYLSTSRYVFNARSASINRGIRFILVYCLHYFINILCLWLLEQRGFNPYLSGLILIIPMAIVSYLLLNHLVYNEKPTGQDIHEQET
ncbi:MAG TPA: GtrA family protein [Gammaproteobacteria bacterium]|nr:GtrA family protein [Gammaproteobacteria bacterium]